MELRKFNW